MINPRKSRSARAEDGTDKHDYESTHLFHLISMSPPKFGGGIVLSPSIDRQVKNILLLHFLMVSHGWKSYSKLFLPIIGHKKMEISSAK